MRIIMTSFLLLSTTILISQNVVINEVLSVNDKSQRDPIGDFDDFIELHNPSSKAVNISKYFISDDKDSLIKCMIPSGTTIPAKGFILIWVDGETNQEGVHCNFKLSSKGERIILSNSNFDKLDEINLKRQYPDVSYGRFPDGSDEWKYMNPSGGKMNVKSKVLGEDRKKKGEKMKLKIDPGKDKFLVEIENDGKLPYRVMDKEEKILLKGTIDKKGEIVITSLDNGKYTLLIGKNEYRILKEH